jgi:hypothetical protein
MENPLTPVKNVREVWNKNLNQKVKEVLVQVKDENPAWIPLETLLALQSLKMIQVTENEDNSLTISWDETSPTESILNTWTEDDFIKVIMERIEELKNNERQD